MIQRRQFLGSVAAFCASTGCCSHSLFAGQPANGLQWKCEVIETVPHDRSLRHPVITDVSLQPEGDLLAVVGDDHHVCIYNTRLKQFTQHLDQHSDWIRAARFSPDGTRLATAGNDRSLLIWDVNQWGRPETTKHNPEAIFDVAYTNDGTRIATVGFEPRLRLFDVETGVQDNEISIPCPDNHAIAFSNDDRLMAVGGRDGMVRVWESDSGRKVAEIPAHRKRIRSLEFTPAGQIVSAGDDQMITISDPANPNAKNQLRHASKLYSTALLNDDLVATGGSDNKIHVWQLGTLQEYGTLTGHTGTVTCLDYSRTKLVSGSYDTHIRLWSTEQNTSAPHPRQTEFKAGWNPTFK